MNNNDLLAKRLVFAKYTEVENEHFDFNLELKLLIDKNYISVEDAFNIIFELMYAVINYHYDVYDVSKEFENLTKKVTDYNRDSEFNSIKNSIVFFKNYYYEISLFMTFFSELDINDNQRNEIIRVIDYIKFNDSNSPEKIQSLKSSQYGSNNRNKEQNVISNQELSNLERKYLNKHRNFSSNSLSDIIREKMELDKDLRLLAMNGG